MLRGCVSLEALSTARAREPWLMLLCSGAGSVPLRLLLWLCPGSVPGRRARMPIVVHERLSRSIFIQNYFNIKVCTSWNEAFACGMSVLSGTQDGEHL